MTIEDGTPIGTVTPSQQTVSQSVWDSFEEPTAPAPKVEAAPKAETTLEVPKKDTVKEPVVEAKVEETPEKGDTTPKEGGEAEAEETLAKALKLKTKAGREVEVDLDTKVTKKIDGVEQEISLKDVLDNYAGKVAYDKKFTELDTERKSYYADKDQTTKELSSIMDFALDNKAGEAILEMARVAKIDPAPLYKAFQDEVIGPLDKFMQMSPEQRESHLLKRENEFLRKSQKSLVDEESKEQAQVALNTEITKLKETLKVKDESIVRAKEDIAKNPDAYKKAYEGKDLSPKQVIELADAFERWDLATTILTKVDPKLAQDNVVMEIAVNKLRGNKHLPESELIKSACELFNKPLPVDSTTAKVTSNITSKAKQAQSLSDDESPKRTPRESVKNLDKPFSWDDV